MSPMTLLARFHARPRAERRLVVEAVCWLGLMRLAILLVPLARIMRWFGVTVDGTAAPPSPGELALAKEVGRIVVVCAAHTPWSSACLAQALAAMAMLRRRSIGGTVHLGVGERAGAYVAHAWLRCGDTVLTGAAGHESYAVIARFSW